MIPLALFVIVGGMFGAVVGAVVTVVASDDLVEQRDYGRGRAWLSALGLGAATLMYFIIVSAAVGIAEFGAR